MRQGEVLGLRRDRVELPRRMLTVDEQLVLMPDAPPDLAPPKTTASRRTAPLADVALQAQLRRFTPQLLVDGGVGVRVAQGWLGHATADETLNTYAHLWPDTEDRSRTAVDVGLAPALTAQGRPRRSSEG